MLQQFLEKQKKILEEEHNVEIQEHNELLSQNTSIELQQQGYAINKLKLKSTKTGLYGRTLCTFAHPHYSKKSIENPQLQKSLQLPESKFSNGDNILIYKFDTYFDKKQALENGVIYKKTNFKIIISFDKDFQPNRLQNEVISLVIETNEITYKRCAKTLDQLSQKYSDSNFQGSALIRVLIDGDDPSLQNNFVKQAHLLKQDTHLNDYFNQNLNKEQKEAVEFALKSPNIALIHGPPGTGKTSTVCELILQAVKMGMKVLACAGSNIAVDNIVERLQKQRQWCKALRIGHPARMIKEIYESCLDFQISKTPSYQEIKELKREIQKKLSDLNFEKSDFQRKKIKDFLSSLRQSIREQESVSIKEVLNETQVICCTNTGADDYIFKKEMKNFIFDLIIIDECAQSMELSCWIPLLKGKRAVFAGDHKQLQPTIKSLENKKESTLFDRVHNQFPQTSKLLQTQYRMNNLIMQFSSQFVYNNQLLAHDSVANHSICQDLDLVLLFVDTSGAKMGENVCEKGSKYNLGEADLVSIIVDELTNLYKKFQLQMDSKGEKKNALQLVWYGLMILDKLAFQMIIDE
ncbi:immunoglobulin mu binding protein 2, putative [Ichthyophthirius multifiliis]|uniref:DNA helicase n=1 Tax=Ichthyophthirius multifiliis TaxID=5932 RepID=G0QMF9_ICHMU|nr:immunoglobulin mu binding protein 2, putative [Ichthyophthirius multifiliis]EGR33594.1 immunoglobulin mu binding protein 2, putative [Ichthyophthirius multifiliis]|eukprot:XP_004037580.1 immunoglobulin mu binding protein 2, putative [Ichthyophthirius multifiliis]